MHRAWRGRAAAAALVVTVAGVLVGCNPPAGEATLTVTGAVEADSPDGAVTCLPSGPDNRVIPKWEWNGTIDGQAATFEVGATFELGSEPSRLPDEATFSVGNRTWEHLSDGSPGEVVSDRVDDDGTLHVTATLFRGGGEEVQITAALRCPSWGHAEVSGFATGPVDGTATCEPPTGSDDQAGFEITSSWLEGSLDVVRYVTFEAVDGPAIDRVVLLYGPMAWTAANLPGQPAEIEIIEQQADRLVVRATLTASTLPGLDDMELEATVACS